MAAAKEKAPEFERSGAYFIGDWRRAYRLLDRHDVRITLDEVTEPGFTKFYVRKRVYGHPAGTNSAKFIKTAA